MTTSPAHTRIPALDGVRGFAVLIVFIYHYGGGAQSSIPALRLIGVCNKAGWCGVSLFFLLSGFLISGILWDDRNHPNWWRRFYLRRTLRIFPLYYAALLLVLLSAFFLHRGGIALAHLWVDALYLQNIPQLSARAVFSGTPLRLTHFWSLAVEEQFYLLWPFLLLRARTLAQARNLCLTVFALSAIFRFAVWMAFPTPLDYAGSLPARAGELALGAWLTLSFREPGLWRRVQRFAPAVFYTAILGFICVGLFEHDINDNTNGMFLVGLLCITLALASILALSLGQGIVARLFSTAWLRWLGGISYGIYVIHILLAPVFDWVVSAIAPHASRDLALGLRFFVAGGLTLLLAQISFTFFERPIQRLRNGSPRENSVLPKTGSSTAVLSD